MSYHLIVVSPFGGYKKGDHIDDPTKVAEVLSGPNLHSVVKFFPAPEHLSGDFRRTDDQIKDRDDEVRAKLGVAKPGPAVSEKPE